MVRRWHCLEKSLLTRTEKSVPLDNCWVNDLVKVIWNTKKCLKVYNQHHSEYNSPGGLKNQETWWSRHWKWRGGGALSCSCSSANPWIQFDQEGKIFARRKLETQTLFCVRKTPEPLVLVCQRLGGKIRWFVTVVTGSPARRLLVDHKMLSAF